MSVMVNVNTIKCYRIIQEKSLIIIKLYIYSIMNYCNFIDRTTNSENKPGDYIKISSWIRTIQNSLYLKKKHSFCFIRFTPVSVKKYCIVIKMCVLVVVRSAQKWVKSCTRSVFSERNKINIRFSVGYEIARKDIQKSSRCIVGQNFRILNILLGDNSYNMLTISENI